MTNYICDKYHLFVLCINSACICSCFGRYRTLLRDPQLALSESHPETVLQILRRELHWGKLGRCSVPNLILELSWTTELGSAKNEQCPRGMALPNELSTNWESSVNVQMHNFLEARASALGLIVYKISSRTAGGSTEKIPQNQPAAPKHHSHLQHYCWQHDGLSNVDFIVPSF